MKSITTFAAAITLSVGVAACGSASGSSSSASGSSHATTSSNQSTTVRQGKTQAQRLTAQTQSLLGQMAAATHNLRSGNSSTRAQARTRLAQLHAQANKLEAKARTLPATTPARPLIEQTAKQASSTTTRLETLKITPAMKQQLANVQRTLSGLSSVVGQAGARLSSTSASQLTNDLRSLERLIPAIS